MIKERKSNKEIVTLHLRRNAVAGALSGLLRSVLPSRAISGALPWRLFRFRKSGSDDARIFHARRPRTEIHARNTPCQSSLCRRRTDVVLLIKFIERPQAWGFNHPKVEGRKKERKVWQPWNERTSRRNERDKGERREGNNNSDNSDSIKHNIWTRRASGGARVADATTPRGCHWYQHKSQ